MTTESALFQLCKSSYSMALSDMVRHIAILLSLFAGLVYAQGLDENIPFRRLPIMTYFVVVPLLALQLTRTFAIFHDCLHESYFPDRAPNRILATFCGILTFTSPNWMLDHSIHHRTNGNVDNKYHFKFNELLYFSAQQYKSFTPFYRAIFTFFHCPVVFFTFFPLLYFGVIQRFIYILKKWKYGTKVPSSMTAIVAHHVVNHIGLFFLFATLLQYRILTPFLVSTYIAWIINFLLFFNQHTYNPCYVVKDEEWTQRESGILGSSFIQIPPTLAYFTMGIEYHHVHHMNSRIPGYNTEKYHFAAAPLKIFKDVVRLSLSDCVSNLHLVLYDHDRNRYITRQQADMDLYREKME